MNRLVTGAPADPKTRLRHRFDGGKKNPSESFLSSDSHRKITLGRGGE